MKFIVHFSRVLIGLLFIVSGIIKLNDPTGFSYKLDEYFTVFAADLEATQDSVSTTIAYQGESQEAVYQIRKNDSAFALTSNQTAWLVQDSIYTSTISIYQSGVEIFKQQLVASDSFSNLGSIHITSKVGSNKILDEQVALQNAAGEPTSASHEASVKSYVKADIWAVDLFNWCREYALFFAIFVSWLEAILGFALLIGWQPKFTLWALILLSVFFAFLVLYSWMYDKVTDCGCFGSALPMTPEESFLYKNAPIMVFLLIMYLGRKHIKPIFSNSFGVKVLTILTLMLVGFSMYCKHYLPVVDFLHYAEGTDIRAEMKVPEGKRATDHIRTTYLYKAKDGSGKSIEVVYDSDKNTFEPKIDYAKYAYDTILKEKLVEAAYEPPIHDFAFYNAEQDNNYIDDFWLKDKKLLLVMHDVTKSNPKAIKQVREIAKQWTDDGNEFWALTASSKEDVEAFRHDNQISEFDFYYGDNTNLKSIIRSNPGLLLITDTSVVTKVWPSTRLPKYKKILKKSE